MLAASARATSRSSCGSRTPTAATWSSRARSTNLMADARPCSGWVLTVRDVTDRQALQQELSYQAFHDALTGLANRQLFGDRLAHALRRRDRATEPLSVLFLDLDDFKHVNDSLGHGIGDRLLVTVAERISAAIRQGDTAARLGGDEFAVLMEDADADDRPRGRRAAARRPSPSRSRSTAPALGARQHRPRPGDAGRGRPATTRCATPTSRCTGPRTAARAPSRSTRPGCTPRRSTGWRCAPSCSGRSARTSWCCTTSRPST